MRRLARTAIGVASALLLVASSFVSYGYWTRSAPPSFSEGGAFRSTEPDPAERTRRQRTKATTEGERGGRGSTVSARPPTVEKNDDVLVALPQPGTYVYDGSGREQISVGASCSWDIGEVTAVVRRDGGSIIGDWTYSEERQERHISRFRSSGVYNTFVGAAVTCFGVRNESEEHYSPAARRLALPLAPGSTWNQSVDAGERHEEISGEILRTDRITVPAGTFDVVVFTTRATFSGSATGTFEETAWLAPALGMIVKSNATTDVRQSGAHFTSTMKLQLASLPS